MHGLHTGGLEQLVLELATRSRALGFAPAVVSLEGQGIVGGALKAAGIEVVPIEGLDGLTPALVRRLSRELERLSPEVVHAHDPGPWLNALLALPRGAKLLTTIHQVQRLSPADRLAQALAARFTAALVGCGAEVTASLAKWAPRGTRLVTVENGIPLPPPCTLAEKRRLRAELGVEEDALLIGYLGRMHVEKGVDLLVEAFRRAFPQRRDARLLLIGPGPLEAQLRRETADEPRIMLRGDVSCAARLLGALDIYAQPSLREGRSLAMLEAMAAGLPTVAHALPAVKELHSEGSALLVPSGDLERLAGALRTLSEDGALRRRLGDEARRRVARFSIDATVASYAELYASVTATKRAG